MSLTPIFLALIFGSSFFISIIWLIRGRWFTAWLKGSLALMLCIASLTGLFTAWQMAKFSAYSQESAIGTLSAKQLSSQKYIVAISLIDSPTSEYLIYGDYWQIDARLIIWDEWLSLFSVNTAYQLDRLSGRYDKIDQEQNAERSVYDLRESILAFDLWDFISSKPWLPGLEAKVGSGTFVPLKDGAKYSLWVQRENLLAKSENKAAESALNNWK